MAANGGARRLRLGVGTYYGQRLCIARSQHFFALGGDSILSIQLVSRARSAGLTLTPRDVFQRKTVEAIAGTAALTGKAAAISDVGTGALAATPIMRWLESQDGPTDRFHQSMLLAVPGCVEAETSGVRRAATSRRSASARSAGGAAAHATTACPSARIARSGAVSEKGVGGAAIVTSGCPAATRASPGARSSTPT